jgi:hypothetical protein
MESQWTVYPATIAALLQRAAGVQWLAAQDASCDHTSQQALLDPVALSELCWVGSNKQASFNRPGVVHVRLSSCMSLLLWVMHSSQNQRKSLNS